MNPLASAIKIKDFFTFKRIKTCFCTCFFSHFKIFFKTESIDIFVSFFTQTNTMRIICFIGQRQAKKKMQLFLKKKKNFGGRNSSKIGASGTSTKHVYLIKLHDTGTEMLPRSFFLEKDRTYQPTLRGGSKVILI